MRGTRSRAEHGKMPLHECYIDVEPVRAVQGVHKEDRSSSRRRENCNHSFKSHIYSLHWQQRCYQHLLYHPIQETHYDINASSDFVAGYASQFLQDLYGLGARRIGLLGLSPIGCVPSQRTVGGGKNRDCYEDENQLASAYNAKHSGVVDNLKTMFTLPDTKIIFLDIYYPLLSLIENPGKYGRTFLLRT
ncbi:GDSL esterase/lipase EXL3-like [Hibiscus syriacus]|uniref:GDSL esterase/lipase EXL3-like n=1 Tax=Hibiscus syriacus TaxID=106335 RepID=UPI00192364FD|nr:GDSL esterase/lipase EXL3-like [Hibiscus syriacus]